MVSLCVAWHENHYRLVSVNNKRLYNIDTYSDGEQCLNGCLFFSPIYPLSFGCFTIKTRNREFNVGWLAFGLQKLLDSAFNLFKTNGLRGESRVLVK